MTRILAVVALCACACGGGSGNSTSTSTSTSSGKEASYPLANAGTGPAVDQPAAPDVIVTSEQARAAAGELVTLRGTAANAKLGRVIMLQGGPVYCGQDDEWPDTIANTTVTVSGRLLRHGGEPAASDEIAARVDGEILRLADCAVVSQ